MAYDLGQIDLRIKADERQLIDAHRKAGAIGGKNVGKALDDALKQTGNTAQNVIINGGRGAGVTSTAGDIANIAIARQALGGAGGRAAALMNGAGAAAPVLGAIAAAGAGVVISFKAVTKAINRMTAEAQRLASVSPFLATVQAQNQVGSLLRDVQRANRIGGLLGYTEKAKESIRNRVAPFKDLFAGGQAAFSFAFFTALDYAARGLTRFADIVIRGASLFNNAVATIIEGVANLIGFLPGMAGASIGIKAIAEQLREINDGLGQIRKMLADQGVDATAMEINRIMTRDFEELTSGAWRFPIPPAGGR